MLKIIVVDDEQAVRNLITNIISDDIRDVQVVAEAHNIETALRAIRNHHPDLVLLDINMPDGTAFDLLKNFDKITFNIIFVTAWQEYAVQAFKFSAVDYLLKPVDPDELVEAVKKAFDWHEIKNFQLRLNTFLSNIKSSAKEDKRIVLRTAEAMHVVSIQDIIRCESDKSYTQFYLTDGRKPIVSRTMKEFDEMLTPYGFFRSHQSHLINLNYLESFEKRDGGYILLKDKSIVPVSVRKKDELISILENL